MDILYLQCFRLKGEMYGDMRSKYINVHLEACHLRPVPLSLDVVCSPLVFITKLC